MALGSNHHSRQPGIRQARIRSTEWTRTSRRSAGSSRRSAIVADSVPAVLAGVFWAATGSAIMRTVSGRVLPVSFELGGKNAALVFADAEDREIVTPTLKIRRRELLHREAGTIDALYL